MTDRNVEPLKPLLSEKQIEYLHYSNSRWNIKSGATRSGKTYLDYWLIPDRIRKTTGEGACVILGLTNGTIQRNIIEPMQNIYGKRNVSNISSNNTVMMFGKKVHVLGAEKKHMAERLRGITIEYAYGDEIAGWSQFVFEMLKTRLSLPNSKFDGTCNPKGPDHWLKKFIDDGIVERRGKKPLVFYQPYTLYDNPFLDEDVVADMEQTITGVFAERNIWGRWSIAEGIIYENFAKAEEKFLIDKKDIPLLYEVNMGVDFGGNGSKHAFVVTGTTLDYDGIYILASKQLETGISVEKIAREYVKFLREVEDKYGYVIEYTYTDSAEQVIPIDMKEELNRQGLNRTIRNSYKGDVISRIEATTMLIGKNKLFYTEDADTVRKALRSAVWKEDRENEERLDDGTTDIDSLDAFEYSWSHNIRRLVRN